MRSAAGRGCSDQEEGYMSRSILLRLAASAAGSVALVASGLAAAPAMAASHPGYKIVCSTGQTETSFSAKTTPWEITNRVYISNWNSTKFTHSETETRVYEITAGISVEDGIKVSGSAVIASLEANFDIKVEASGSVTGSKSVTNTVTANPYTFVVGYQAAHKVKAVYLQSICNVTHTGWDFHSSGTVTSWTTSGPGVVNCPKSKKYKAPPSGTAPSAALKYCT